MNCNTVLECYKVFTAIVTRSYLLQQRAAVAEVWQLLHIQHCQLSSVNVHKAVNCCNAAQAQAVSQCHSKALRKQNAEAL
jgi:hypothetical protein